ncbi:hypothetical protein AB0395_44410 [Streptosporangium sp. NPDC051023]|uniref:hypothetical protein n=1 Tax=Streptosporangium sp. NPDC051023 TaxID=3155410 RepID=UPI00345005C3
MENIQSKRTRLLPWTVVGLLAVVAALVFPCVGGFGGAIGDGQAGSLPASMRLAVVQSTSGGGTAGLVLAYQRDGGLTAAGMDETYGSADGALLAVTVSPAVVPLILTYCGPLLRLVSPVGTAAAVGPARRIRETVS